MPASDDRAATATTVDAILAYVDACCTRELGLPGASAVILAAEVRRLVGCLLAAAEREARYGAALRGIYFRAAVHSDPHNWEIAGIAGTALGLEGYSDAALAGDGGGDGGE